MSNKKGIARHCEYLESKIKKKQSKIDGLRLRIDKAIEYLKETTFDYGTDDMIFDKCEAYQLLSILKGEDK